jgi:hypothetical protein
MFKIILSHGQLYSDPFSFLAILFVVMVFVWVILFQIIKILINNLNGFRYRVLPVGFLLFALIINGTVIAQKSDDELNTGKTENKNITELSFGYSHLGYSHYHAPPKVTFQSQASLFNLFPSRTYSTTGSNYAHSSHVIGCGITHIRTYKNYKKLSLTGELSGGLDIEKSVKPKDKLGVFDISSSAQFDFRWLGAGVGFHSGFGIGENGTDKSYKILNSIYYSLNSDSRKYAIMSGSVRLFPYDIFYTEVRYNELFPYQIGHRSEGAIQILFGTGFGFTDGRSLEVGFDRKFGNFISVKTYMDDSLGIKASFYSGVKNESLESDRAKIFQFSVLYRLNRQH